MPTHPPTHPSAAPRRSSWPRHGRRHSRRATRARGRPRVLPPSASRPPAASTPRSPAPRPLWRAHAASARSHPARHAARTVRLSVLCAVCAECHCVSATHQSACRPAALTGPATPPLACLAPGESARPQPSRCAGAQGSLGWVGVEGACSRARTAHGARAPPSLARPPSKEAEAARPQVSENTRRSSACRPAPLRCLRQSPRARRGQPPWLRRSPAGAARPSPQRRSPARGQKPRGSERAARARCERACERASERARAGGAQRNARPPGHPSALERERARGGGERGRVHRIPARSEESDSACSDSAPCDF